MNPLLCGTCAESTAGGDLGVVGSKMGISLSHTKIKQ